MAIDPGGVFTAVVAWVVPFLYLGATSIILGGGVWSIAMLVRLHDAMKARREFSRSLLLGLDFTIGASVLNLAAAPNLSAAASAAAVTAVRIALTMALLREERTEIPYQPKLR